MFLRVAGQQLKISHTSQSAITSIICLGEVSHIPSEILSGVIPAYTTRALPQAVYHFLSQETENEKKHNSAIINILEINTSVNRPTFCTIFASNC